MSESSIPGVKSYMQDLDNSLARFDATDKELRRRTMQVLQQLQGLSLGQAGYVLREAKRWMESIGMVDITTGRARAILQEYEAFYRK